ncbi:g1565 [Coccomyxa elongata]
MCATFSSDRSMHASTQQDLKSSDTHSVRRSVAAVRTTAGRLAPQQTPSQHVWQLRRIWEGTPTVGPGCRGTGRRQRPMTDARGGRNRGVTCGLRLRRV